MKKSVLFVCMGNICRSPAAEGIFRGLILQQGDSESPDVDSAGTIDFHTGKPADARMQSMAGRRGYELTSRARQVKAGDLEDFGWVIAMDRENLSDLRRLVSKPKCRLHLLSDFLSDQWPSDVPDPYYGGEDGFNYVLDMLEAGLPELLRQVVAGEND